MAHQNSLIMLFYRTSTFGAPIHCTKWVDTLDHVRHAFIIPLHGFIHSHYTGSHRNTQSVYTQRHLLEICTIISHHIYWRIYTAHSTHTHDYQLLSHKQYVRDMSILSGRADMRAGFHFNHAEATCESIESQAQLSVWTNGIRCGFCLTGMNTWTHTDPLPIKLWTVICNTVCCYCSSWKVSFTKGQITKAKSLLLFYLSMTSVGS